MLTKSLAELKQQAAQREPPQSQRGVSVKVGRSSGALRKALILPFALLGLMEASAAFAGSSGSYSNHSSSGSSSSSQSGPTTISTTTTTSSSSTAKGTSFCIDDSLEGPYCFDR